MYRIILLLCFILIFQSCQKEEYNLPADVYLEFHRGTAIALEGDLQFYSSYLHINNFRFLGERNVGDDIDFLKEYNVPEKFVFFSDDIQTVKINIPRGLYELFTIKMGISEGDGNYSDLNSRIEGWLRKVEDDQDDDDQDDDDDENNEEDDDNGDVDDDIDDDKTELEQELGSIINAYLAETTPGIIMEGILSSRTETYVFVFVLEDELTLALPVYNAQQVRQISFDENENLISLSFDTEKWLKPLSNETLRNAWKGRYGNQQTIFIHKKINPELYTILLSRLEEAFHAIKTDP